MGPPQPRLHVRLHCRCPNRVRRPAKPGQERSKCWYWVGGKLEGLRADPRVERSGWGFWPEGQAGSTAPGAAFAVEPRPSRPRTILKGSRGLEIEVPEMSLLSVMLS